MNAAIIIVLIILVAAAVWYSRELRGSPGGSPGGSPSVGGGKPGPAPHMTCTTSPLFDFARVSQCSGTFQGGTAILTAEGQQPVGGRVLAPDGCSEGSDLVMQPYDPANTSQMWWVGTSPGGFPDAADGVLINVGCQREALFSVDGGQRELALDQTMFAPQPGADPCKDHEAPQSNIQINADSSLSNPVSHPSMFAMIDPQTNALVVSGSDVTATKWDAHVCVPGS